MMQQSVFDKGSALGSLWSFLKEELAPFPGRMEYVLRFMLATALVMLISIGLDIPFLTLTIIVVFLVATDNIVVTTLSGILTMVGSTLVTILYIPLIAYTVEFPALRIVIAGSIVFFGMYIYRLTPLGALGYMCALSVIFTQSIFDSLANPELLLRVVLWVWVAGCYPVFVTLAVNFLVLPSDSRKILPTALSGQLDAVIEQLTALRRGERCPVISMSDVERSTQNINKHFALAAASDKKIKRSKELYSLRIATINRLYNSAAVMSDHEEPIPHLMNAFVDKIIDEVRAFKDSVSGQMTFTQENRLLLDYDSIRKENISDKNVSISIELQEMSNTLHAFSMAEAALAERDALDSKVADAGDAGTKKKKKSFLPADAATNPVYARFAFKTLLATMICYLFYRGVQWEGIHTCMLTCILVALPGLGSMAQKAVLRISGCFVGSVLTLLVSILIIPHLDTLGGFMMLSLPIIGLAAWVNVGSERINYAGMQIGFAYALALFGSYGPSINLVEIRDRLIGVTVGVIVSTIVYSFLWPDKESNALKTGMANLLQKIGGLLSAHQNSADEQARIQNTARSQAGAWQELSAARKLKERVKFEGSWEQSLQGFNMNINTWFASTQELIVSSGRLQGLWGGMNKLYPELSAKADTFISNAVACLEHDAAMFKNDNPNEHNLPKDKLLADISSSLADFEKTGNENGNPYIFFTALELMRNIVLHLTEILGAHNEDSSALLYQEGNSYAKI